jgi:hypothetical protein
VVRTPSDANMHILSKKYILIVQGLWWWLVGCNVFFLFYFAIFEFFYFLFPEIDLWGRSRYNLPLEIDL